ncbi:hypothetical protein [Vibrio breoganii]|uniref:hypothetical protein n=1 Tax=Vibrio breoganii TaxID=553239 RepID=UPI0021C26963|nr:hypothetical protein [Vibrio breoganii]MDN3716562.1 hypothetical protein [Vibrio breoganii]
MNRHTLKQVHAAMAHYKKKGIPYRQKQIQRLISILDDIFQHEPNVGEQLNRLGRKQIVGYWRRTEDESEKVRREKFVILKLFFEAAGLSGNVPEPKIRRHALLVRAKRN